MKLVTDNKVYVQKDDIIHLLRGVNGGSIPASVFNKCFSSSFFIVDDSNRYEFIEFDSPEDIEYWKNQPWSIDYIALKDEPDETLISLGESYADKQSIIANEFNSLSGEEKEDNYDIVTKYEILDFMMFSLRDIILMRKGELDFPFPEGLEYLKPNNSKPKIENKETKQSFIKRFINKFSKK